MKNTMKLIFFRCAIAALLVFPLVSCEEEDVKPQLDPNKKGSIELKFDNVAGSQDFAFGTTYQNSAGETFKVNVLQYYISNISFKKADGTEYIVPQDSSYFLIREQDAATQKIRLSNIPLGDYTEVSFIVGVDSLRSTLPPSERKGVLDIGADAQGMYWTWNSGYIFFKMEGTSAQIPVTETNPNGLFKYHIGGFGGYSTPTFNNIRKITLPMNGEKAKVRDDSSPSVHILVDILKVFEGDMTISLAQNPIVMGNPFSLNVSKNYMNAFVIDHIH